MRISKKTQYGLRAMVYLASFWSDKKKIRPLKEIAEKESIPADYLEKVMSLLEKKKLLKSKRGVQGGYSLYRSPKKITAGEIIKALEGSMAPVKCVALEKARRFNCPRKSKCKAFNVWSKIQQVLISTLDSMKLSDLL